MKKIYTYQAPLHNHVLEQESPGTRLSLAIPMICRIELGVNYCSHLHLDEHFQFISHIFSVVTSFKTTVKLGKVQDTLCFY